MIMLFIDILERILRWLRPFSRPQAAAAQPAEPQETGPTEPPAVVLQRQNFDAGALGGAFGGLFDAGTVSDEEVRAQFESFKQQFPSESAADVEICSVALLTDRSHIIIRRQKASAAAWIAMWRKYHDTCVIA